MREAPSMLVLWVDIILRRSPLPAPSCFKIRNNLAKSARITPAVITVPSRLSARANYLPQPIIFEPNFLVVAGHIPHIYAGIKMSLTPKTTMDIWGMHRIMSTKVHLFGSERAF